jgi:glutamate formiminotransferase/formiminotetrahydrofolate cyclodeaminase
LELVAREAQRYGVSVASSEVVGLVPQNALDACADFYLKLENFSAGQVLENRLAEALSSREAELDGLLSRVAAPDPAPGGGSAAAVAGALAAALGEMVAGLTETKKKYEPVHGRMREVRAILTGARQELQRLVQEDAAAYAGVMDAFKLPKQTDEQKRARSSAIEKATRRATETPLRTARLAAGVLEALETLVQLGNPNARSDAAAGAQLAFAALKSAQYNVLINLPGLEDGAFIEQSRTEANRLVAEGQRVLAAIDALMTS